MYRSTSFFGSRHLFLVLSSRGTCNNPPLIPIEPLAFQGAPTLMNSPFDAFSVALGEARAQSEAR